MTDQLSGACLCGSVTFTIFPPFRDVLICHCRQCARWTGHLVAATAVSPDHLHIETGEECVTWYRSSGHAERGFCSTCGSNMFWRPDSAKHISIMAGTIDDPQGVLKVGAHWHVATQRAYVATDDKAPRYPGASPPADKSRA